MKSITTIVLLMMVAAALTCVLFVSQLKPTSHSAFLFFAAWLMAPYVVISAALIFLQRKKADSFYSYIAAVLVCIGGILYLVDIIFWHPDAQGAIAVLMAPILQGIAFAILLPFALWLSSRSRP